MVDKKFHFLVRVPEKYGIYKDAIEFSMQDPKKAVMYRKRIIFISSKMVKLAEKYVCLYMLLDPEMRKMELRMLKHPDDYGIFSVKRKGFSLL